MNDKNKRMSPQKLTQLEELLTEFFDTYNVNSKKDRNLFHRNKVAALLRKRLKEKKRWKTAPRGLSSKGGKNKTWEQLIPTQFEAKKKSGSFKPAPPNTINPPDLPRDHPDYCPF
jgi:hypothetical protein